MPAQSFKAHIRGQVRFSGLSFGHQEMVKLGTVGVSSIKNRVHAGLGPDDTPAKPLSKKWAAIKRNIGLRPIRDLYGHGKDFRGGLQRAKKRRNLGKFVGHMLDDLKVISVTIFSVKIGLTAHAARIKGRANQLRQPWLVLSPNDSRAVREAFGRIIAETKLLVKKAA